MMRLFEKTVLSKQSIGKIRPEQNPPHFRGNPQYQCYEKLSEEIKYADKGIQSTHNSFILCICANNS
jgi:hypothetical protein